jgi:hypothetical protein
VVAIGEDTIDGSHLLQLIKAKFANHFWIEDNFISTIGRGRYKIKDNVNIILFDDFIGTGETINTKFAWMKGHVGRSGASGVNLKLISIACMEEGFDLLKSQGIDFFTPLVLKKGISGYHFNQDALNKKQQMLQLEAKLMDLVLIKQRSKTKSYQLKHYSLGYEQSETLYAIEGMNISDNVFPIFWWPYLQNGDLHNRIFERIL